MKKCLSTWGASLLLGSLCTLSVYAGGINEAEQQIVNTVTATYSYNGEYYEIADGYIDQVIAYLSGDGIDLSQSEVDNYISQFYGNIGAGISAGYLTKVEMKAPSHNNTTQNNTQQNNQQTGQNQPQENNQNTQQQPSEEEQQTGGQSTGENITSGGSNTEQGKTTLETQNQTEEKKDENKADENQVDNRDNTKEETKQIIEIPTQQSGVVDNTLGSTIDGEQEYTVSPLDHEELYVWDTEELKVHAKAYKDSQELGVLSKGEKVTVTGAATTGWAEILYQGEKAYVSAVYLRTEGYMIQEGIIEKEEPLREETTQESLKEETAEEESNSKGKDYSDAEPFQGDINIGVIAAAIAAAVVIIMAVILWLKKNNYKR